MTISDNGFCCSSDESDSPFVTVSIDQDGDVQFTHDGGSFYMNPPEAKEFANYLLKWLKGKGL